MKITQEFFELPEALALSMTVRGRAMLFMLLKIYSFADENGEITYTRSELAVLCRTRTQEINHCFEACKALLGNPDFSKSLGFKEDKKVNASMDACMDTSMDACMDASMNACMDASMNACMDASMDTSMNASEFTSSLEDIFNYCEKRRKASVQAVLGDVVTYDEPLCPWDEYICEAEEEAFSANAKWREITSEEGDKIIEALMEELECTKQRKETPIKETFSPTPPYKENITKEKKLYISARVREDGADDMEKTPRVNAEKDVYEKDMKKIVDYLNRKLHTNYKMKSKRATKNIKARLKEGYTFDDFKEVIDKKHDDWISDSLMIRYLKPTTLFSSEHFDEYLNQPVLSKEAPKEVSSYLRKGFAENEYIPKKDSSYTEKSSFNIDEFFELAVRRGAGRAVGLAV